MTDTLDDARFYGAVLLTNAAGTERAVLVQTGSATRWALGGNVDAEGGGNDGTNLVFARFDDGGNWIDNPVKVLRATGDVEVGHVLTVGGRVVLSDPVPTADDHAASKQYVDARAPQITVSTVAPSSPAVGDIWIDTT